MRPPTHKSIIVVAALTCALVCALALAGCSRAVQNTTKPIEAGQSAACLTNEKTFESQVSVWSAANPGTPVPGSLTELVSAGVVSQAPVCPEGGTYTWDAAAGTLTCSVHGHWE